MPKITPEYFINLIAGMSERLDDDELAEGTLDEIIKRCNATVDLAKCAMFIWDSQVRASQAKDMAVNPENFRLPAGFEG